MSRATALRGCLDAAAVGKVISGGYRTGDVFSPGATNVRKVSTSQMGDAIAEAIRKAEGSAVGCDNLRIA